MDKDNTLISSPKQEHLLTEQASPLKRMIIGLVLIIVVVGFLSLFQLFHTHRQALQQAETHGMMLAGTLRQNISAIIQKTDLNVRHVVDEVVHQYANEGIQADDLGRFIERQFKLMPELDSLSISDARGMLALGSGYGHNVPVSIADRDYFIYLRDHPDAGMVISKPVTCKISNKWVITCARRITLADGTFGGIAYAELPLQKFSDLFRNIPVGDHGIISFRRIDLTLITLYSPLRNDNYGQATDSVQIPEAWQTLLSQGKTENGSYSAAGVADGIRRIHSYSRISPYPLYINVGLALDDILAGTRQELLVVSVFFGLFLGMSILLIWQSYRSWQKTFAAEKELKRNYARLELMQEVSQYHAENVQDLLDFTLGKVVALTESSIGYIYHYNEEERLFVLNTWSKDVMAVCRVAEPQSVYLLEKTGLWGEVVRQRRPIMVNDYSAPSEFKKGYPEGHVHLLRFLSIPVFDNDRIVAVVGVANKELPYDQADLLQLTLMMEGLWKIASRLKLEEQILRAGHEWQSTFDAISDSIALIDTDQRIIRCNQATSHILGRTFADIINQPCWKLFHGADAPIPDCPMARAKQTHHSETTIIQHNDRWLEVSVDPLISDQGLFLSAVHIVRDITDSKKDEENLREMQTQLLQNDKLATIGQLAAGVAHEINNPMGFVGSNMVTLGKYIEKYNRYIDLIEQEIRACSSGVLPEQIQALRRSLKLDYVMRDISLLVDESNEGIDRVKRIVQDLRTFSRADSSVTGSADLNSCLDSTINIVINEIKYAAELKREYGDLPKVSCNVQQINQVFMNLLINAAHAIQAKGDAVGEIVIRTWCDDINAFVAVSDNGCGIPPENCGKIFNAFYTTKEVGKGTGLGLSISAGIIRKHGGEIMLSSEVGIGSTFTVRLPLNQLQKTEEKTI